MLEIDTTHYKGNAPDRVSLSGYTATASWSPVLPSRRRCSRTRPHRFRLARRPAGGRRCGWTYFPDGGIARLRVFGRITPAGREQLEGRFAATSGN